MLKEQMEGGERMKHEKERDDQAYATNLLIAKVNLDPKTGIQRLPYEDQAEARKRVDANEK